MKGRITLFTSKAIDEDVADWQFEGYAWLIKNLGLQKALSDTELWLPADVHFGDMKNYNGHDLAQYIFRKICERSKMDSQAIKLTAVEENMGGFLGDSAILKTIGNRACGRYFLAEKDNGDGFNEEITYDIGLCETPMNLIATLAHESAHAIHSRSHAALDVEPELYELFTDLTAVYLGYGIFLANSRFSFASDSRGWQAQGAGYLPEADLVFATAIFMKIKNIPLETAKPYLKPKLFKILKKSFKQLGSWGDEIEALKALVPISLADASAAPHS